MAAVASSSSAAARARTNHITKSDMEASRLVFVYVRDAKPKRKVAVPVPDGFSWEQFLGAVKQKLKIVGIKDVQLVSTGQRVTSLDELQDIDELCVTEGVEGAPRGASGSVAIPIQAVNGIAGGTGNSEITSQQSDRQQASSTAERGKSGVPGSSQLIGTGSGKHHSGGGTQKDSDSAADKYARRTHPLKRALQKWLPALFSPSLPVSSRDAGASLTSADSLAAPGERGGSVSKRKKGRRSVLTLRNVLLLLAVATCMLTILWFMLRAPMNLS